MIVRVISGVVPKNFLFFKGLTKKAGIVGSNREDQGMNALPERRA
jgi:hypothetical protein